VYIIFSNLLRFILSNGLQIKLWVIVYLLWIHFGLKASVAIGFISLPGRVSNFVTPEVGLGYSLFGIIHCYQQAVNT